MKKIIIFCLVFWITDVIYADDLTGIKIYVNPGHGGYDSNDRNVVTIPFALGNQNGFWESFSNLLKGLALRDLLLAENATVYISRTTNTTAGDRALSDIAAEANANNIDAFLSIHSNALVTNTGTNYLLLLYHGDDGNPTVAASLPMAQTAWSRLFNNLLTVWTHYTASTNCRGDFSFYGNTSGLGVLRPLTVPGFLSEGSFHDYPPETHRLLNADYCKLEAIRFFEYFHDYFQKELPAKGVIAGLVKSENEKNTHPLLWYKASTDDQWLPLNGATVQLLNADGSMVLNTYTTDNWYNGVFAFYDLSPGSYRLAFEAADYESKVVNVTVEAGKITYQKTFLHNIPGEVVEPPPAEINPDDTQFSAYPNPTAAGYVNVYADLSEEQLKDAQIDVYDMTGQLVQQIKTVARITRVSLPKNAGIYLLRIHGKHVDETIKVVAI